MSHPSPDLPEYQPPAAQPRPRAGQLHGGLPRDAYAAAQPADPFSFKFPGGVLLIVLGALNGLAAFTQVLTGFLFAPWHLLLLSLIGLAIAFSVTAAGILMLWRRRMPERLSPMAGIISTGALLMFMAVTRIISGGGLSGLLFPVAVSIPIFIIIGRGMSRTKHLMPS